MTRAEELLAAGIATVIGLLIVVAAREWGRYLRELDQWRRQVEQKPTWRGVEGATWQQLHNHRRGNQP